jgi:hypothetical protein
VTGRWVFTTPTRYPLAALAAGAAAIGIDPHETTEAVGDPQRCDGLLAGNADASARETQETAWSGRVVLIVDQLEETFTECQDETERQGFIAALYTAASTPTALVVLGLRADFYGRCLAYPTLLAAVQEGHLPLGSMSVDQLREAISRPADAAGLRLA